MESHYCRATSSKSYLEPNWTSKNKLYQFYCQWCKERDIEFASSATFCNIFEDENLSLFLPKKDECDICISFKNGNYDAMLYKIHQDKKSEARQEKQKDKQTQEHVYTMDLQSVLLCPKSNVSSAYFKTKLVVHNFTVYDLKASDGFCFLWNESEGRVSSNEFSTILTHFISDLNLRPGSKLILYSDGCAAQNRNVTLANALLNVAMLRNLEIEQKFLEKGHTQMEADSMHSCIERALKNKNINVPADYIQVCKDARQHPKPYKVEYLTYNYFKDFTHLKFYNSIRPERIAVAPTVTDIRALRYQPNGKLMYKLRFKDHWDLVPSQKTNQGPVPLTILPSLYTERRKIKKSKFLHLQELKQTLPKDYHGFYDTLPFSE